MKQLVVAAAALLMASIPALAQWEPVTPVDPARFRKLSCDEIAARIQKLNVPIGDNNSTIAGFRRSPTLEFLLLGTGSRSPEFVAMVAKARGERNALIAVAVEKDCAAKRLVPMR
ncbi:hypothetical protein SAMN02745157_4357 [Kaistia soli DSM 19436]|uniref:Uncharacterized protein n=1 Tax=Kaistia soli DSM 19436 TaxID=1122133 RepID=A0A1M5KDG8_9HYPH|nr:hypothetical protein [Kaistia soli]SHG50741.1 hypothetical protein SAMN02745157_4357 [Kaistia soli DSM 19436]